MCVKWKKSTLCVCPRKSGSDRGFGMNLKVVWPKKRVWGLYPSCDLRVRAKPHEASTFSKMRLEFVQQVDGTTITKVLIKSRSWACIYGLILIFNSFKIYNFVFCVCFCFCFCLFLFSAFPPPPFKLKRWYGIVAVAVPMALGSDKCCDLL